LLETPPIGTLRANQRLRSQRSRAHGDAVNEKTPAAGPVRASEEKFRFEEVRRIRRRGGVAAEGALDGESLDIFDATRTAHIPYMLTGSFASSYHGAWPSSIAVLA
jgi:hypothetical protein